MVNRQIKKRHPDKKKNRKKTERRIPSPGRDRRWAGARRHSSTCVSCERVAGSIATADEAKGRPAQRILSPRNRLGQQLTISRRRRRRRRPFLPATVCAVRTLVSTVMSRNPSLGWARYGATCPVRPRLCLPLPPLFCGKLSLVLELGLQQCVISSAISFIVSTHVRCRYHRLLIYRHHVWTNTHVCSSQLGAELA